MIIGCTIDALQGSFIYSDKGEELREKLNDWIRTSGAFDGVIDSDAAVRSSDDAKQIRADFDSGDHLHPTTTATKRWPTRSTSLSSRSQVPAVEPFNARAANNASTRTAHL